VKRARVLATLGLIAAGLVLPASGPVGAAAPSTVSVFQASSTGTPVGIITRVPAESPGGILLSSSEVRLGKAMGKSAALTLGPLGDTFVVTSQPAPLFESVPGVVVAQTPPSENAPEENAFEHQAQAGPVTGLRLHAVTSDAPEAMSEATGTGSHAVVLRTGASTSDSRSAVDADGTVHTVATATTQDVEVGPAGSPAVLRVASVTSRAAVRVPPGGQPVTELSVHVSGALLAGVPVSFDEDGVSVAGNVAVPSSSIATVNDALEVLAEHGLTLRGVPTERSADAQGAATSGAALAVRYVVPRGAPRFSDIGTDQTFLLGSVRASATARQRQEPSLPELLVDQTPDSGGEQPFEQVGSTGPLTTGGLALSASSASDIPAPTFADEAASATPTPRANAELLLPVRASTAVSDELAKAYRSFLLAAAAALLGLHLTRRTRRTA
jgi:hypothetical protein